VAGGWISTSQVNWRWYGFYHSLIQLPDKRS
jgi:hypothetical protein